MATETEIIYHFLLERAEFSQLIPKEKFAKFFPPGTSENLISAFYKHLSKLNTERVRSIEDAINKRENEETRKKTIKLNILKKKHDNSSISTINEKLELISQILVNEEASLEEQYNKELQSLKDLNDEFNGIIYNKTVDESVSEESIKTLIESLQEFEQNIDST